ncbi:MAG TPA: YjbQ family protein [Thermopetrobacter sp.]|nr:YjbQ family protein [Thermopetrobacter sp.]
MKVFHDVVKVETPAPFAVIDITERVAEVVGRSGVTEGQVVVTSQHTTCAISVNENEARLLDDIEAFFLRLAPPDLPYRHNDLHLRENIPPDEPKNAHAHLIAMLLGNGEALAVRDGAPVLGRYQSILLAEMDGPRSRRVVVQVTGA